MNRMLCLLLLVALLGGCTGKIIVQFGSNSTLPSPVAGLGLGTKDAKKAERAALVEMLDTRYQEVRGRAAKVMIDLEEKANRYSLVDIWVGLGGVAAGVAASALVVASPANAVWVAALSGAGSGAVGYQTSLAAEGMSRASVVTTYTGYKDRYNNATLTYGQHMGKMAGCINTTEGECTDAKWAELMCHAVQDIFWLQTIADTRDINQGEQDVLKKQTENFETIIKQQQDFQKSLLEYIKER